MFISDQLKQKLFKLNRIELRSLAEQADNLEAFNALDVEESYKKASMLLGIEKEFEDYMQIVLNPNQGSVQNVSDIIDAYHHFLMAKICFPEEA